MASIPVVAAIVFLTAALFFLTFFSSFIRRCSPRVSTSTTAASHPAVDNPMIAPTTSPPAPISRRGLDHTVIDSFPTFDYATVSSYNHGNGALECYVCFNEFEAHETLRLIPVCDHAFHVGCIDAWLASNATCPICRANLHDHHELTQITEDQNDDVVIINVTDHQDPPRPKLKRNLTWLSLSSGQPRFGTRLARSKSTGPVAVKEWEMLERFTLRMPEEVRRKIGGGKLRRSMTSSDEGISGRRGNRVTGGGGSHGEESSWGRWFFRRSKSTS